MIKIDSTYTLALYLANFVSLIYYFEYYYTLIFVYISASFSLKSFSLG